MLPINKQIITKLDSVLEEIYDRWELPGLAVAIIEQTEISFLKTLGFQNLETHLPLTSQSLFSSMSISKTFTSVAVMQLVEAGRVSLDTPVQEYLPYFKLADPRTKQITIRQILSHTSGMPDMDEMEYIRLWKNPQMDAGAAERMVRSLSGLELAHPPGEAFLYSNIAYNILGDLIAKVSGVPFETYMRQKVLIPSGMPNSTFLLDEVPSELLAMPHLRLPEMTVSPYYPFDRADGPSSNLLTNIVEMGCWAQMCLNRGKVGGIQVLQPESFATLWTPVVKRNWPPLYAYMGLGWNLGSLQDTRTVSHGGAGAGMNAFLLVLPDLGRAGVMMYNAESEAQYNLIDTLKDTLCDIPPQPGKVDWMVPICQAYHTGGRQGAFQKCAELQANKSEEFSFEEGSLIWVVFQMLLADRYESALDLLDLTIHTYPAFMYARVLRAQVYLEQGINEQAQKDLLQVIKVEPGNSKAIKLLEGLA